MGCNTFKEKMRSTRMSNFSFNKAGSQATRESFDVVMDKIKTARSLVYTVTASDITNKYSAMIPLNWDSAYADTNYTVSLGIEAVNVANISKDGYAVARFTKTSASLGVVLSIPNGTAGDTVLLHGLAIHD